MKMPPSCAQIQFLGITNVHLKQFKQSNDKTIPS